MRRSYKRRANCIDNRDNGLKPYLPSEITFYILIRVPPRYLVSLKTVCKQWKDMISSREFSEASLRYWRSRQVVTARDRAYAVIVPAKENIDAMKKWINGEIKGIKNSRLVRQHLSWCGWTFSRPPKGKYQIPAMKYPSPDGKVYNSLVRACKAQCGVLGTS